MRLKINKAIATFTERSHLHTPSHNSRAPNQNREITQGRRIEEDAISETIRTKGAEMGTIGTRGAKGKIGDGREIWAFYRSIKVSSY
jgi:hypothetical protein